MDIYLVMKVATYNHDIFGAFEKQSIAIEKAIQLSRTENDDYHSFEVVHLILDATKEIRIRDFYGQYCEQNTIFSIKKLVLGEKENLDDYNWNLNLLEI